MIRVILSNSIECSAKTNNIQGHFGLNLIKKEFRIYLIAFLSSSLITLEKLTERFDLAIFFD